MMQNTHSPGRTARGLPLVLACLAVLWLGGIGGQAKSVYLIANIDADPTPLRTYDLQSAPLYLQFQAEQLIPNLASGAVGLAVDSKNKKLFITYENGNRIQILDAETFRDLGYAVASGAVDLAGIVVDQGRSRVYAAERGTNRLHIYDWNSSANQLTAVAGSPMALPQITSAFGLALDEGRSRLFIADSNSTALYYFSTSTWVPQGSFVLVRSRQTPVGIAVDSQRNFLYTGNAVSGSGLLVKYDLNTGTESLYTLPQAGSGDQVAGIAVDEETGYIYATTGNINGGGTGSLYVLDSDLNVLRNDLGRIGHPTGIAIPKTQLGYNPLNFSMNGPSSAVPNTIVDYSLCFETLGYGKPVSGLTVTNVLPSGLVFTSATQGGIHQAGTVTWNLGSVAANTAPTCLRLAVTVTAASGLLVNTATIRSNETPATTQSSAVRVVTSSTTVSTTTTTTSSSGTTSTTAVPGRVTMALECPGSVVPGVQVTIPVRMTAPSGPGVASFQMDLQFNRLQLAYVGVQRGPSLVTAGKDLLVESGVPGVITLLVLGGNQGSIPSGVVLSVVFQVSSSVQPGNALPVSCANLYASDPYAQLLPAACSGGGCSVGIVTKCGCDANKDGAVLVNDTQLLVNMVLGSVAATCDVNGDGLVDIKDLQIVINAILDPQHRCLN